MTGTLDRWATFAVVALAIMAVWFVLRPKDVDPPPPPLPVPSSPISLGTATEVLKQGESVALVVYSDFQCPYCARFAHDIMPALEAEFSMGNELQIQFRHLPLTAIHPMAVRASVLAHCAGRQGKFRQAHDALFANQARIPGGLDWLAAEVGLDASELQKCEIGDGGQQVQAALREAESLGFMSTPTILIGHIEPDGSVRVQARVDTGQLPDLQRAVRLALQ